MGTTGDVEVDRPRDGDREDDDFRLNLYAKPLEDAHILSLSKQLT